MKRWELEIAYYERGLEIEALKARLDDQAAVIAAQATAIAELKTMVEELRRAGNRQAGRFARDADKLNANPPGSKSQR